ncbi:ATPase [Spirochaetia bacterium]|nr:ATPase [Spirochaetia bacterium]
MSYIHRHLEDTVKRAARNFAAVLVTGARQVGKTRLLRELYPRLPYISMDDVILHDMALTTPHTIFKNYPPPVILDEVQYAPNLFTHMKLMADGVYSDKDVFNHYDKKTRKKYDKIGYRRKGLFFMSGSQQFALMKNVSESMSGRIGILNLLGLSRRELIGDNCRLPFIPLNAYYKKRNPGKAASNKDIWKFIQKGSLPEIHALKNDWEMFYSSYVSTYIERDVKQLVNIGESNMFYKFMIAMAAHNGQLLNYTSITRDIGLSPSTAERWTSILLASNIIYLLQPYHNNILKRAIKTPKVYFLDTGLACYLSGWNTSTVLERGAAAGSFFETFVIGEIIKSYTNAGREPPLYFYRDKEQNEIDLLIYENGTLYPLEIKKHGDPSSKDIRAFRFLDIIPGVIRGTGGVICTYSQLMPLSGEDMIIPVSYL